jgi:transcriptional antiterminator RfaH
VTEASQPRWYAVQTQPRAEVKASAHLGRQGFGVYLPRYLKRRRHARRIDFIPAPLFPRYLFIAIELGAQRWRSIQSTIGVARLVCNGDEPAPLASSVIEALQQRQDQHGFIQLDVRSRFSPGDKIRVVDGPFSSCLGLFEGMTDTERVTILLDLLGRKVRAFVGLDSIAAS